MAEVGVEDKCVALGQAQTEAPELSKGSRSASVGSTALSSGGKS